MRRRIRRSNASYDKRLRWISVSDLLIILDNLYLAEKDRDIGFEDPRETLESFCMRLNRMIRMYTEDIEGGLWACNLLDEKKKFRHPRKWSFDRFLKKILRGDEYNKDYNFIDGERGSVL